MSSLTFISLFSGIGGFDLGFQRAGMQCVAQVEWNAKASAVLEKHWPDVPRFGDVKNVGQHNLPAADVLCGGFPCQDVSVAGRRAGLAGERSGLWFEFLRILTEVTPRWVVIENVPGLLSSNGGRDFAAIIHGMVKCGYRVCWRVLDAQYFGVPQRRRRVFIVGYLTDGRAAEVLFEREGSQRDTPPRRETRESAATYAIKGAAIGRKPENGPQYGEILQDGTTYTLNTSEVHAVAGTLAASGAGTARPAGQRNELDLLVYGLSDELNSAEELMGTLNAASPSGGGQQPIVAFTETAKTLTQNYGRQPANSDSSTPGNFIGEHGIVRRLTPTECERLQGFPDGWTAGQSDSERYRQLGNAVCVNVSAWIGRRIVAQEAAL